MKAHSTKKTAESAENICAMKRLLKMKTYEMTFHQISRHFVSGGFEKVAWAVHATRECHPRKNWVPWLKKQLLRDYLWHKAHMGYSLSYPDRSQVIAVVSSHWFT